MPIRHPGPAFGERTSQQEQSRISASSTNCGPVYAADLRARDSASIGLACAEVLRGRTEDKFRSWPHRPERWRVGWSSVFEDCAASSAAFPGNVFLYPRA